MTYFPAAQGAVSGGISVLGMSIPAVAVIAFLLGCYVGRKWL